MEKYSVAFGFWILSLNSECKSTGKQLSERNASLYIFFSFSYNKGTFHCWNWENTGKQNDEIRNHLFPPLRDGYGYYFSVYIKYEISWHLTWWLIQWRSYILWWEDKRWKYDFQPRLTCVKRTPQIWVHQGTENKSKWMDLHPVYIPNLILEGDPGSVGG